MAALPVASGISEAVDTRVWLGPDYWANPLQDWRKAGDRIECHVAGGDRNVFWLVKEIAPKAYFRMSVRLGELPGAGTSQRQGWAGFRIGMRGHFNDYRDTAIRGLGVEAGVSMGGRLFIGKEMDGPAVKSLQDLTLTLEGKGGELILSADGISVEQIIAEDEIHGGVALVCHSGELPRGLPDRSEPRTANSGKPSQQRGGSVRFWFRDWLLDGDGVASHPERAWGPILFTQYAIAADVLKMTAQLAPMEGGEPEPQLMLKGRAPVRANIDTFSSTAAFALINGIRQRRSRLRLPLMATHTREWFVVIRRARTRSWSGR